MWTLERILLIDQVKSFLRFFCISDLAIMPSRYQALRLKTSYLMQGSYNIFNLSDKYLHSLKPLFYQETHLYVSLKE